MIEPRGEMPMFRSRRAAEIGPFLLLTGVIFTGIWWQPGIRPVRADRARQENSAASPARTRIYENTLTPIENPAPLLADYPEFIEPVVELRRFEAPVWWMTREPISMSAPGGSRTTPVESSKCPITCAQRRRR
jgi:hypothetical protein